MKKCPFCAELIQDDAVKCRFCGSDLLTSAGRPGQPAPEVVCAYCKTRNAVGSGTCMKCGRKLPLRGLQYSAAPTAPPKKEGCLDRAIGMIWAIVWAAVIFGVIIWVVRTYG